MQLIINLYNLFFTVCGTQTTFSRSIALATTFQWLETIFNLAFKVFISNSSFASLTCFERNSPFGEYWRRTLPTCNCTNMFSTISGKKGQITYPQGVCWPHNVTWPLLPCLCCMQKWIKNENSELFEFWKSSAQFKPWQRSSVEPSGWQVANWIGPIAKLHSWCWWKLSNKASSFSSNSFCYNCSEISTLECQDEKTMGNKWQSTGPKSCNWMESLRVARPLLYSTAEPTPLVVAAFVSSTHAGKSSLC